MVITYRALIKPIPPSPNLSNIHSQPAALPCSHCQAIIPDRRRVTPRGDIIPTAYDRIITYPEFPELKAAWTKCSLCRLIRKAIRSEWAVRPMEDIGFSALDEDGGLFDELLETEWDRKVRVFGVKFTFSQFADGRSKGDELELAEDGAGGSEAQMGGMVTLMHLSFGPANTPEDEGGKPCYGTIAQTIAFKVFDSVDLDAPDPCTRRHIPRDTTLSPTNVELMNSWIRNCEQNHPKCALKRTGWLPTRLLEVYRSDEDRLSVRLVATTDASSNVRSQKEYTNGDSRPVTYAALSHVWGDITVLPPLRTVRSNYDTLKKGVDLHALPRNFSDSVLTCEALGIWYLWIDSLCIIQDDTNDWEHEASLMHLVYKYAKVTLVA